VEKTQTIVALIGDVELPQSLIPMCHVQTVLGKARTVDADIIFLSQHDLSVWSTANPTKPTFVISGQQLTMMALYGGLLIPNTAPKFKDLTVFVHGVVEAMRQLSISENSSIYPAYTLTGRETEVFELLARGIPVPKIAASLGISPNTVRQHIANVKRKLRVRDRTVAVLTLVRLGLITPTLPDDAN
jgi:LuxR family transcriptional regulator, transcriptional regulator of spore coat protein